MPGLADLIPRPPKRDMDFLKSLMESQKMNDLESRVERLEKGNQPRVRELTTNQPTPKPIPYTTKTKSMWDEPCSIKGVVLIVLSGITLPLLLLVVARLIGLS